ncbi:MAG TPA: hypothetical protein VN248_06380 [Arenimonas sp.]|nr:hypothetical protein [Arenimonas sp.]
MRTFLALVFVVAGLTACSEPPRHQIVFSDASTCRIVVNDLQYGAANDTERPCAIESAVADDVKAATVNFLSEKCNAYRYTFKRRAEDGGVILGFQPSENIPNAGCDFIPEYSNPEAEWHLSLPEAQSN